MTEEERASLLREQARCQAKRERLRGLAGDPAARRALALAWQPLLDRTPIFDVPCALPYDAHRLLA